MSRDDLKKTSKFLSLVLRHQPEAIGVSLDEQGWVEVDELLAKMTASGRPLTRAQLERVVAENDKRRFAFSDDGERIRANQGHSVEVDLNLPPREPPEALFHGTAQSSLGSILARGLHSGSRQHVHLSTDEATANKVGQRHGQPVVLRVRAGVMWQAGAKFYLSENGVWLTDAVPPEYIETMPFAAPQNRENAPPGDAKN